MMNEWKKLAVFVCVCFNVSFVASSSFTCFAAHNSGTSGASTLSRRHPVPRLAHLAKVSTPGELLY